MTHKDLLEKVHAENEALFEYARVNVEHFFNNPETTKEDLLRHFVGRLSNERLNMVEVAASITELPLDTSVEDIQLLCKQASDEAVHFKLVKEVIEHIVGEEVDHGALLEADLNNKVNDKGGYILDKYNDDDELALVAYQIVAEGRAAAMWQQMEDMAAVDGFVAKHYGRIARDEAFHAKIGMKRLKDLIKTPEDEIRFLEYVDQMRKDLYEIQVGNKSFSNEAPGSRELLMEAYGW